MCNQQGRTGGITPRLYVDSGLAGISSRDDGRGRRWAPLEAVPVTIQSVAEDVPPLRVQVVGTPTVTLAAGSEQAGVVRQQWQYRDVTIPASQGPAGLLNVAGADGWEATGVTVATQAGTVVVMKRPR
jgi:hypothetical protein